MAVEFLCKVCRGHLKPKTSIILTATNLKNRTDKGLVFLNPEIGNYTHTTHSSFQIRKGEEYIFTCPICNAQLNSMKYLHLVRILMIDEGGNESSIYFSGIGGEKCTYKIRDDKVEASTGPDVKIYNKYFDVPEEDRKYL
jgi:transcription elongation factor Elf1